MLKFFDHTQFVPSDTWVIDHNLNCKPATDVNVYVGPALTKILPVAVKPTSLNQLLVTFTAPYAGVVRCGALNDTTHVGPGSVDPGANVLT